MLLTQQRAELAVNVAMSILAELQDREIIADKDLHITILDPAFKGGFGEGIILYERSVGDQSKWNYNYEEIARLKAKMTYEHKLPSKVIVEQMPYLLEWRDIKYWGSAYMDGIIVAVSGFDQHFDQMLAEIIASLCKGFCFDEMYKNIIPAEGGMMDGQVL
jgi:hypothetical protein